MADVQSSDLLLLNRPGEKTYKITVADLPFADENSGGAGIYVSETPPDNPIEGTLWWADTDVNDGGGRLYVWLGDEWVDVSLPGAGFSGDYNDLDNKPNLDLYLSTVTDDTVNGAITFKEQTTHEGGVQVTGGTGTEVTDGLVKTAGSLSLRNESLNAIYMSNGDNNLSFFGGTSASAKVGGGNKDKRRGLLFQASSKNATESGTRPNEGLIAIQGVTSLEPGKTVENISCFFANSIDNVNEALVENQYGYYASDSLKTAFNVYGYYTDLSEGNHQGGAAYAFYSEGDAPSFFQGLTTHAGGVDVTGSGSVTNGLNFINDTLQIRYEKQPLIQLRTGSNDDYRVRYTARQQYEYTAVNDAPVFSIIPTINGQSTWNTGIFTVKPTLTGTFNSLIGLDLDFKEGIAGGTSITANNFYGIRLSRTNQITAGTGKVYGIHTEVDGANNYNFFVAGTAPSFFQGSAYIGGSTTRNTFELYKSTLNEEQLEQLEAGTLVAPANVSLPGDGSFARQWYYDQQDAETQALLDNGEVEYPTHLAAATFTDTFALGDNSKINLLSNGKIQAKNINLGSNTGGTTSDLSFTGNSVIGYEATIQFVGDKDSRVDFSFDTDGIDFDSTAGNGGTRRAHYINKNYINTNGIYFPEPTKDFDTNTAVNPTSTSCMVWRDDAERIVISSASGRALSISDRSCTSNSRFYSITGTPLTDAGVQYAFNVRTETPAGCTNNVNGIDAQNTFKGGGGTPTNIPVASYYSANAVWDNWEATDTIGELVGLNINTLSINGSKYDGIAKCYGVRSAISDQGNRENYNIYASGTAPNYFKGAVRVGNPNISIDTAERFATNYVIKQIRGNAGPTTRFYIGPVADSGLGNAVATIELTSAGAAFNNTSDYRLKTNIEPLASASTAIQALKPCSFTLRGTDNIKGFLAHELQEVLPEAVTGTKDGTEAIGTLADYDGTELEVSVTEPSAEDLEYTEEVETDGVATMVTRTRTWTPTGTRPVYQGVDQTKLIPLLTKALQEALTEIDNLKSRITALESN